MFKSTLMYASSVAVLTLLVATTGAHAAACTQADMTKMNGQIAGMTDATKKAAAMKEMTTAREMMEKKDDAGCMTHMNDAANMMSGM